MKPKILFITSHAFNNLTGGGITFSNLFSGWPKSSLATVHNDPLPVSYNVCEKYYFLSSSEIDYFPPFNILRKINSNSKKEDSLNLCTVSPKRKTKLSLIIKKIFYFIIGDSVPEKTKLSKELIDWIEDYQPDMIYTILGTNGIMELTKKIHDKYKLPIVVHIMDDWISAKHKKGIFSFLLRKNMNKKFNYFMENASLRLGISKNMCEAYENRYGFKFKSFQNSINISEVSNYRKKELTTKTYCEIFYVGSIFPNAQLNSLIDCCRAIVELNKKGYDFKLKISSPKQHVQRYFNQLSIGSCIEIIEPIEDNEIFYKTIAAADLLLLPVNFDDESINFIQYSMPTKVPAYLAIGTPILIYGPKNVAQVMYALEEEWGIILTERNIEKLQHTIIKSIQDISLRKKTSGNAINMANKYHDAKINRYNFQSEISNIEPKRKFI